MMCWLLFNSLLFFQIEVKVTKMCKPIIAVLHIIISDMVVKSKWFITHMICFKPEELELDIICNSQEKQELDFQYIVENTAKVLPIIFHNKNNINVPVKLSVLHVRSHYECLSINQHNVLKAESMNVLFIVIGRTKNIQY